MDVPVVDGIELTTGLPAIDAPANANLLSRFDKAQQPVDPASCKQEQQHQVQLIEPSTVFNAAQTPGLAPVTLMQYATNARDTPATLLNTVTRRTLCSAFDQLTVSNDNRMDIVEEHCVTASALDTPLLSRFETVASTENDFHSPELVAWGQDNGWRRPVVKEGLAQAAVIAQQAQSAAAGDIAHDAPRHSAKPLAELNKAEATRVQSRRPHIHTTAATKKPAAAVVHSKLQQTSTTAATKKPAGIAAAAPAAAKPAKLPRVALLAKAASQPAGMPKLSQVPATGKPVVTQPARGVKAAAPKESTTNAASKLAAKGPSQRARGVVQPATSQAAKPAAVPTQAKKAAGTASASSAVAASGVSKAATGAHTHAAKQPAMKAAVLSRRPAAPGIPGPSSKAGSAAVPVKPSTHATKAPAGRPVARKRQAAIGSAATTTAGQQDAAPDTQGAAPSASRGAHASAQLPDSAPCATASLPAAAPGDVGSNTADIIDQPTHMAATEPATADCLMPAECKEPALLQAEHVAGAAALHVAGSALLDMDADKHDASDPAAADVAACVPDGSSFGSPDQLPAAQHVDDDEHAGPDGVTGDSPVSLVADEMLQVVPAVGNSPVAAPGVAAAALPAVQPSAAPEPTFAGFPCLCAMEEAAPPSLGKTAVVPQPPALGGLAVQDSKAESKAEDRRSSFCFPSMALPSTPAPPAFFGFGAGAPNPAASSPMFGVAAAAAQPGDDPESPPEAAAVASPMSVDMSPEPPTPRGRAMRVPVAGGAPAFATPRTAMRTAMRVPHNEPRSTAKRVPVTTPANRRLKGRNEVKAVELDENTASAGTTQVLALTRSSKKQQEELGAGDKVLTPVRRSTRKGKPEQSRVEGLLEITNFAYSPNPALPRI